MAEHLLKGNPIPVVAENIRHAIMIVDKHKDEVLITTDIDERAVRYTAYVNVKDMDRLLTKIVETRKLLTKWSARYQFYAVLEVEE